MRKICLIGMGPGGLKYLMAQAIAALRKVDVFSRQKQRHGRIPDIYLLKRRNVGAGR
jgi:precorrin-2 methylase